MRRTKSEIVKLRVPVNAKGGHQMRCERRPNNKDAETTGYTFYFQIANDGGRQACSVKVQALNVQGATAFLRQNWPMIESTARAGVIRKSSAYPPFTLAIPG